MTLKRSVFMALSFIIGRNWTPPIFTSGGRINDCGHRMYASVAMRSWGTTLLE